MTANKKGLGKGLGVLIPTAPKEEPVAAAEKSGVIEIDINKIEPNKGQPRKHFDDESLQELAMSLKEYGIISPIVVKEENGFYKIIAGERRYRAARIARFEKVPVIIKEYNEQQTLQVALIENIQRQDLNPIEEALCYKRLQDEFFFSQDDIAGKVGKSRNSISASLSLLHLDAAVQNLILENKLTIGHGRLLLTIKDPGIQLDFAEKIIDEELSVKEAEKAIRPFVAAYNQPEKPPKEAASEDNRYAYIERDLRNILGARVSIRDGKNKGKIEIEYYSADELDRLLGIFKRFSV